MIFRSYYGYIYKDNFWQQIAAPKCKMFSTSILLKVGDFKELQLMHFSQFNRNACICILLKFQNVAFILPKKQLLTFSWSKAIDFISMTCFILIRCYWLWWCVQLLTLAYSGLVRLSSLNQLVSYHQCAWQVPTTLCHKQICSQIVNLRFWPSYVLLNSCSSHTIPVSKSSLILLFLK